MQQDGVGNLTSVTPADRQAHRFTYTAANEVASYAPPALPGVSDETTTYDLDGLVTRSGHADGSATVLTRDEFGRATKVTTPWWATDITYVSSTAQVESLTRGAQRLEWQYDGFLMKEEKATGVAPATTQWSYDLDFRVAQHTLNGAAVSFAYDDDSLLTQVGPVALGRVPATGQLASATVGTVSTAFTYNAYGETETLTVMVGGAPLYSEGLSFDAAGRLTVVQEVSEGTPVQWAYGHDAMGRLTSATRSGSAAQTWAYDGNGNRVLENGVAATHDAQDRLLTRGATTYGWDALGGRTTKTVGGQVTRYVHDGLGALTSVTLPGGTVVAYEYDGRHRRVAKRRSGVVVKRWVYDGQYRVVAEVDGAGAVTSRFVYGSQSHSPDALLRGGVTYAYVKNHLGSVKYVVEAGTGVVAQRLDYDAWGNVVSDSSPGFQPLGFVGGVYDGDTGLVHFGYRDYDPESGTWTSKDPIRLAGGRNSFEYGSSSPMESIDSTGLEPDGFLAAHNALLVCEATGCSPQEFDNEVAQFQAEGRRIVLEQIELLVGNLVGGLVARALPSVLCRLSGGGLTAAEKAVSALASKLRFTATAGRHMGEAGRYVPRHILADAIRSGAKMADPQGAAGAVRIVQAIKVNGNSRTLEVVYREADNTILHFLYR